MAFITVQCDCGKSFKVESSKAGRKIRCGCGAMLLVPDPSTAPAPEALEVSASTVAPMKAARLPRRAEIDTQSYHADNKSNIVKLALLGVGVVVICLGLVLAYSRLKGQPIVYKGQDAQALDFLRTATEARQWVQGRDVMLGGMSQKQAAHRIEQWYELGAKKIHTQGKLALMVVIELPDDVAKRQALFEWYANFVKKSHETPVPDEGQKYLLVKMPMGEVN